LNGQLRGVPGFNAVSNDDNNVSEDLDKEQYSLWPMRVANWRGLIFVQPNPEGPIAMHGSDALELFIKENKRFCDRLSGFSQDDENGRSVNGDDNHNDDEFKKILSGIALEDFTYYSSSTHKLNCNWKVTLLWLTVLTVDR
jgi:phenylpropionate dioxygenase-like ring-hydroxylating dioxygenase large terminal subunit